MLKYGDIVDYAAVKFVCANAYLPTRNFLGTRTYIYWKLAPNQIAFEMWEFDA